MNPVTRESIIVVEAPTRELQDGSEQKIYTVLGESFGSHAITMSLDWDEMIDVINQKARDYWRNHGGDHADIFIVRHGSRSLERLEQTPDGWEIY